MEFNQVFKYSLFSFFSWEMLGVSSILVTIQFELVEYNLRIILILASLQILIAIY